MKGYRTRIFNAAALVPLIGHIIDLPELKAIIPAEYLPYYTLALVIGNLILRELTTTPAGKNR